MNANRAIKNRTITNGNHDVNIIIMLNLKESSWQKK